MKKKTSGKKKNAAPKRAPAGKQAFSRLIVKRRGHVQHFDERKLYSSVFLACMSTHRPQEECEAIATSVCKKVMHKLPAGTISAHDLFHLTADELKKVDEEIAFMYKYHFDIS